MTHCITATQTEQAYQQLVEAHDGHGGCPDDDCASCGPFNEELDRLAQECEDRGCTLERCVFRS